VDPAFESAGFESAAAEADWLFGPEGPLARAGLEARDGQGRMARLVAETLEHEGVLLVEAGTGTGKTLAYLLPALRSGRRVVVSTGTRHLQDQIVDRELPRIEGFGLPVRAAVLKGLGNYLCRRRYLSTLASPEADAHPRALPLLQAFAEETETGDQVELPLAEDHPLWLAVRSGSDTRIGPRCKHYETCFVTQARRRASEAALVVVNHHLYFADLALKSGGAPGILPEHDAVIFDEAHQLEDVATAFFGARVSEVALHRLVADGDRALGAARRRDADADRHLRAALLAVDGLFDALPPPPGGRRAPLEAVGETVEARYHDLDAELEVLERRFVREADADDGVAQVARRVARVRAELASILDAPPHAQVVWVEGKDRLALGRSPVDIADRFRDEVLHRVPSVVLTSATLTTDGKFDFIERRLGVDFEVSKIRLPTPFDVERRAALYLPSLPDPREPTFEAAAFEELARLVALTDGGAFVLTTSNARMRAFATLGRRRFPHRVLLQGELPKATLLARFREVGDAVLFATQGFWEGVDVPGDALRLVILDRLPFDVPTDPLVKARCARLEAEGESAFARYLLPSAALALKQGFGRLLRTSTDRGIVALLDARVRTRGYGKVFLRSLPPARRCEVFEEVAAFWQDQKDPDATGKETVPGTGARSGDEVEPVSGGASPK
jgi:ATP-dependent DNA helicase DinG